LHAWAGVGLSVNGGKTFKTFDAKLTTGARYGAFPTVGVVGWQPVRDERPRLSGSLHAVEKQPRAARG
jgi:hypothetical protein